MRPSGIPRLRDSHIAVLGLLLSAVGLLLAAGLFFSYLHQTSAGTAFTNIAGRQRMLSQQMLVAAHRILLNHPEDRATLRSIAAEFERNLHALETGGVILGRELPPAPPGVREAVASTQGFWQLGKPELLRIADAPISITGKTQYLDQLDTFLRTLTIASDIVAANYEQWSEAERIDALANIKRLVVFDMFLLAAGAFGVRRYLSERMRTNEALRRSEEDWRRTFDSIPDLVSLHDRENRILRANQAMGRYFGVPADQLIGKYCYEVFDGTNEPSINCSHERAVGSKQVSSEEISCTETSCPFQITISPLLGKNGEVVGAVHVARDISELRRSEENMEFLSNHDPLTRLPNRALFLDRLSQMLVSAQRHQRRVGVLLLNLDRFKVVNNTLDHAAGDLLLQILAQRLKEEVRVDDTVSRLGGDEFAIALADIAAEDDAALIAEKILMMMNRPFVVQGRDMFLTASIGISLYPGDANDATALTHNAEAAMHRVKSQGKNAWQRYSPEHHAGATRRLRLETDLRRALNQEEFILHYQPKLDIATGQICGAEALLRWQHPELGLVQPIEFISLLEDTGLIVQAGAWVLRTACAQARSWQQAGLPPLNMAVNVTARQFQHEFTENILKTLDHSGLASHYLELEITESVLMENSENILTALNQLTARGVRLAIDDFGTGYSSLSYLTRFPVDTLKIDRSFVRDIANDSDDAAIVQAVIAMAHTLGLTVVAEGVETKEQLYFLQRNRCDEIQGYYLSHPLDAEAFTRLLKNDKHRAKSGRQDPASSPEIPPWSLANTRH